MSAMKPDHVVVWEKFYSNAWFAYSPCESNDIEETFSQRNLGISSLFIKNLNHIDFERFVEIGRNGEVDIKRSTYPPGSAAFSGILWIWEDDKSWKHYPQIILEHLEFAYSNNYKGIINLNVHPFSINYSVDMERMKQINNITGFERKISRKCLKKSYTSYLNPSQSQALNSQTCVINNGFLHNNLTCKDKDNKSKFGTESGHNAYIQGTSSDVYQFSGQVNNKDNAMSSFFTLNLSLNGHITDKVTNHLSNNISTSANQSISNKNNKDKLQSKRLLNNYDNDQFAVPNKKIKCNSTKPTLVHQLSFNNFKGMNAKEALKSYYEIISNIPLNENCVICCDSLKSASAYDDAEEEARCMEQEEDEDEGVLQFNNCKHVFHVQCIFAMYENGSRNGCLKCPSCNHMYGLIVGDCPDGTMRWWVDHNIHLPGHETCDTIIIEYNIKSPTQKSIEINGGRMFSFSGFPRSAFLPLSQEGHSILQLLSIAWQRRLTFTIGTSVTTGRSNVVVWNEIHHKTEITNEHGHGYPDDNYFSNVVAELASQGVTYDDIFRH